MQLLSLFYLSHCHIKSNNHLLPSILPSVTYCCHDSRRVLLLSLLHVDDADRPQLVKPSKAPILPPKVLSNDPKMRGGTSSQRDNNHHPSSTTKKSSNPLQKETLSNETKTAAPTAKQSKSSSWWDDQPYYTSSTTNKLILTSVLSQFLPVPLLLLPFLHLVYGCLVSLKSLVQGNSGTDGNNVNTSQKTSRGRMRSGNGGASTDEEENDPKEGDYGSTIDIDDYDPTHHIQVPPSPGLTTLLDTALYKAYQAELVPTTSAASQLLQLYIEMKESAALILRECRWCVGVPLSGGLMTATATDDNGGKSVLRMFGSKERPDDGYKIAIGGGSQNVFLGGGVVVDESGKNMCDGSDLGEELPIINNDNNNGDTLFLRSGTSGSNVSISSSSSGNNKDARVESLAAMEIAKWNEFDIIQDFAQQCYLSANEAIHRLSTDRLSDSANLTVHDGMVGDAESGNSRDGNRNHQATVPGDAALNHHHDRSQPPNTIPSSVPSAAPAGTSSPSPVAQSASSMLPRTVADFGIGRYYEPLTRQDCWESPRLYCPDYTWADDAIGACQRTLKMLSKHRFLSLVATNGWNRYTRIQNDDTSQTITPPVYASSSPHPFPSLEAVHCLQYLVTDILQTSIPASINKFRAATEANAVVSKRLYLVKCEYRAPMRALWESYTALNAAPRLELVETYLRDYHGVKIGEEQDMSTSTTQPQGGKSNVFKKKVSSDSSKKTAFLLQQQREKMEKLITEKYWKHPIFVEALQLERCCEKLEMDMSQMLLPLANLSREIMDEWKGRVRAVAIVTNDANGKKSLLPCIHWHQLPAWRELLRVSGLLTSFH